MSDLTTRILTFLENVNSPYNLDSARDKLVAARKLLAEVVAGQAMSEASRPEDRL